MNTETRRFTVAPSIITHLIKAQAGSLGKAVAEGVMNSIDAGCTRIAITLDQNKMVIADDGHGLRTRDEILSVFEVFGFDHSQHQREFGRFGLGRGQMWNWASTVWRTHTFSLDVDIRARGLDWNLTTDLPHVDGLSIECSFYKPLSNVERLDLEDEIAKLVAYCAVPVSINGKAVSKDPTKAKWSMETEEAFIKLSEGNTLSVYNQGVFVCDLYRGNVGIAGVLVTKRGHNLTLNMARNDILRTECKLWKKLNAECQGLGVRQIKERKARQTDSDRDFLARQTADPAHLANLREPIFTLANGKHVGWDRFYDALSRRIPITVAESGSRIGEQLVRDKLAFVLGETTLARFGVQTVAGLLLLLKARMAPLAEGFHQPWHWPARTLQSAIEARRYHDDIRECPAFRQINASRIANNELTAEQRLFIRCFADNNFIIAGQLEKPRRELFIARGEGIEAFTDGSSYIGITEESVGRAIQGGLAGFVRMAHLLVHEYLHSDDDSGSHIHDPEFHEAFHEAILECGEELHSAASRAFKIYASQTQKRLGKAKARDLDTLEATT
jgi:hypothetical protein